MRRSSPARKRQLQLAHRKYIRSEKGRAWLRAWRKKWLQSSAGKRYLAARKRGPGSSHYRAKQKHWLSAKGKAGCKRFRDSEAGKRYTASAERQAYLRKLEASARIRERRGQYRRTERGRAVRLQASHRRRNRLKNAAFDLTPDQWLAMLQFYEHRCAYCDAAGKKLTLDHLTPLDPGDHTIQNVLPACQSCNSKKSRKPVEGLLTRVGCSVVEFWKKRDAALDAILAQEAA